MRLHRLAVTAFGPFAQRQEVDFDRLSEAGLFLLHGPTGAGKTSVLDAICFALYGRVPGVRGQAARLRSDHAPAELAPEVVCDFTVSGRRFEVTRSPEWLRPKKRGSGVVREQAHVVLKEWVGGEWNGLTNRIDEAADLLDQVIGLGAEQFTKLILLPQGDFAAFLRATAEERRPLLQKLFGTDRFAEVERWLADRRREFEHHIQSANTTSARLFARAEEARLRGGPTGARGRAEKDGEHGAEAGPADEVVDVEAAAALVAGWAEAARAEQTVARSEVGAAEKRYEKARRLTDEAVEVIRRLQRRDQLTAELAELAGAAPEQERRRAALTAAGHASVLAPLLGELLDAERQSAAARQRQAVAHEAARATGTDPGTASGEQIDRLREELGGLTELLRAETDLGRLDARRADDEQQIETAEREQAEAGQELTALTERQAERAGARAAAELVAVTLADREQAAARATTIARAVLEHQYLAAELGRAEDGLRAAIDTHQAAVGASQELRARRLDGMAAELAAGLGPDGECPVCGSHEHPAPAAPTAAAVTEADQRRAEALEKAALADREQAQQTVAALGRRSAAVLAVTEGADAAGAAAALAEADRRVIEARTAATTARDLAAELELITSRSERATARQQAAAARAAAGRESLAEIDGRRVDLRARLERARGEDADVRARYRRLEQTADQLAECLAAGRAGEEADERLSRAAAAADQAAEAAGFADRAAAGTAMLPAAERSRQARGLAEHDARQARAQALLTDLEAEIEAALQARAVRMAHEAACEARAQPAGDTATPAAESAGPASGPEATPSGAPAAATRPDESAAPFQLDLFADPEPELKPGPATIPALLLEPAARIVGETPEGEQTGPAEAERPDLEALRAAQGEARQAHEQARERHTLATRAVHALSGLAAQLERHAVTTAPLRRQFGALDSVSRCVEGTGGDNALRMRLSSYVLAARLEQVAAAASIRLAAMSGGRYLLVHTDGPSRGGARSGLGLAVIDGWTGVQRDPASLSGGETFCTSLALALGLADVVQAEAGGSVIETLLVDEGFGSLDEETLDEVMDVLDGLRSAGRSVGLVSHVADLRDRIPAQLQVLKTRTGSRLVA